MQSQSGKAVPAISMQQIQQVIKNVQPQHITVSCNRIVFVIETAVSLFKYIVFRFLTSQAKFLLNTIKLDNEHGQCRDFKSFKNFILSGAIEVKLN